MFGSKVPSWRKDNEVTPKADLGDLPHWDLTSVYPGLESGDFKNDVNRMKAQLDDLDKYLSDHGIARSGRKVAGSKELADVLSGYLNGMNDIVRLATTLEYYVYGFTATDSYNTTAKRVLSELQLLSLRRRRQAVLFQGWLGMVAEDPGALEAALEHDGAAKDHGFYLTETAEQSRFLMSESEETLASELALSGADAWGKLQGTVTSQVKVPFELEGKTEELPIAKVQNMLTDADGDLRRRAYTAEIAAWERVREPLAACLNGVKGTTVTLFKRRGRDDALHEALDNGRIDRETLNAMLSAMKDSFPDFRRYWKNKAKRLGVEKLPWFDLWAPVGRSDRRYPYEEAEDFMLKEFEGFYDRLAVFSRKVFERNWIDAEPREGKNIGGFCMELPAVEESRILCNYNGSLAQLNTIAHELGHAYHNECHIGKTVLQRITPMTLAETASIFAQNLVVDAALAKAKDADEELAILESILIEDSQVIVDIYSRYLFETEIFERRAECELSADDFCEIMVKCQKETYGDGLDPERLHPYMWAWKPHYYSSDESFYNFPYAFGMLFGLGLYKVYEKRGVEFLKDYDNLLSSTGMARAAELAEPFGIDIRKPDFWRGGLDVVRKHIERYLEL
jgi:pepF/M3 family oligoendopeptidase